MRNVTRPSPGGWRRAPAAAFLLAVLIALPGCTPEASSAIPQGYEPREGDVVFQSLPKMDLITTIEGATHSPYSHCGVVARSGENWVVIEAISPVIETPLGEFASRSRDKLFDVYRLSPKYEPRIGAFIADARKYLGRPYDFRYRMDDEAIYCSELVFKAFKSATGEAMGKTVLLRELDWKPYEATIRKYEGGPVPLEREMITPRDLAQASQLTRIFTSRPASKKIDKPAAG